MSVISTITTALSAYNPAVGEWTGETTANHVTLIPIYDKSVEADDTELVVDEYIDIHFFIICDYQATKSAVKSALKAAGLAIDEFRYLECENKQHHFVLTVIGRA